MTTEYDEGYSQALYDQHHRRTRWFPIAGRSYSYNRGYAAGEGIPWPAAPEPHREQDIEARTDPMDVHGIHARGDAPCTCPKCLKNYPAAGGQSPTASGASLESRLIWLDHHTRGWWHGGE